MEPKDAVSYFRSKGFAVTDRWQEMLGDAHARAFTVAKAMRMDVLETIRKEVDSAIAEGITEKEFSKRLTPCLQAAGWWGKQTWVDSDGNARNVQLGSPYRLKTIYRTSLQTSYMAGRYRRQLATAKTHPYLMYVAVMDGNTRPSHAKLNGRIFRYDDPIWKYLYPPNGWGCRCRTRALTQKQVDRLQRPVENGEDYIETFEAEAGVDERTGEIYTVQHMRANLPGGQTVSPDIGWAHNPGSAAYGTDIAIAKKLGTAQSSELRSQLIQSLNNSSLRHEQFATWANEVIKKRRPGHRVQAIGFMPEAVSTAVALRTGIEPSRLLVISEKQLIHADSNKHRTTGVALSTEELLQLPAMINNPQAVLLEKKSGDLLFVYPAQNKRKTKIIVRVNQKLKKQSQKLDAVINAFTINPEVLTDAKAYDVISGEV